MDVDLVASRLSHAIMAQINMGDDIPSADSLVEAIKFVLNEYKTADDLELAEARLGEKTYKAENAKLRRMVATLFAGTSGLYFDDGELQDNRGRPFIDFKRDNADDIQEKMFLRNNPWAVSKEERAEYARLSAIPHHLITAQEGIQLDAIKKRIDHQAAILQAIH